MAKKPKTKTSTKAKKAKVSTKAKKATSVKIEEKDLTIEAPIGEPKVESKLEEFSNDGEGKPSLIEKLPEGEFDIQPMDQSVLDENGELLVNAEVDTTDPIDNTETVVEKLPEVEDVKEVVEVEDVKEDVKEVVEVEAACKKSNKVKLGEIEKVTSRLDVTLGRSEEVSPKLFKILTTDSWGSKETTLTKDDQQFISQILFNEKRGSVLQITCKGKTAKVCRSK